jgi:8-oxo-dGTP diphosphatase
MGCRSVAPYVVVAAAIVDGEPPRLLAAQRSYPPPLAGMWELPGGKVEADEDDGTALVRECREELGVEIEVGDRVGPEVPTAGADGVLRTYWARIVEGTPQPLDHAALRWLSAAELDHLDWITGDLPVVDAVRDGITSRP